MTMWDQSILIKKYVYLVKQSEEYEETIHYFRMLFGVCCYIFCEVSTLLDGHVRSVEQTMFFYKAYLDDETKGSYSVFKNSFTGKDIKLQKCCRDFLLQKLTVCSLNVLHVV
jgi:hypothetical protein